jgi:hypothetical protein
VQNNLLIIGSNIKGTGALIWSSIIIKQIADQKKNSKIYSFVSAKLKQNILYQKNKIINLNIINFTKLILNIFFKIKKIKIINISDFPMPVLNNQILFVNQANLISPKFYKFSINNFIFNLKRYYFKIFLKNASKIVVQTNFMRKNIAKSYNYNLKNIVVYNNLNFNIKKKFRNHKKKKIKFLYPANHYPYKNHDILVKLLKKYSFDDLNIYITATKKEFKKFKNLKNLKRISYYNHRRVFNVLTGYDALIFPSLNESLGLPLLECKALGMPIICSNLPFAKELLKKKAIYFDPLSCDSLYRAIIVYKKLKIAKKLKKFNSIRFKAKKKTIYQIIN